jgi:hypothetical protein
MLRLPLASLGDETCVGRLTARVFGLLKKFGGGGATDSSRGEHRDLVVTASQLLVVLIRDVKTSRLEEEQLRQVTSWRTFFVNKFQNDEISKNSVNRHINSTALLRRPKGFLNGAQALHKSDP